MTPTSEVVARLRKGPNTASWSEALGLCAEAAALISSLVAERDQQRDLAERLKLEAQGHAQEARTANSTIYEIYQVLTGATGAPGNWNGAEPARQYVAEAERLLAEARAGLVRIADYPSSHAGACPEIAAEVLASIGGGNG